jgi:DNA repair protein RadD
MKPRDYQQQAIDSVFDYLHRRKGNPLVCAPTGSGKSVVLSGVIKEAFASFPDVRIMMLTHVKELIQQNHAAFCRLAPDLAHRTGILSAGLGRREHGAQFLFAGVQSTHKKAQQVGRVDLVIVDECHMIPHTGTGMYRSLLSGLWAINPDIRVIGLTATPYRLNGGMLCQGKGKLFDSICYDIDVLMLIKRGYLSPLISQNGATEYDTSGIKERGGDFVQSDLAHAIEADDAKTALACEEIVNLGNEQGRRSWLVFCSSVKHAEQVQGNLAALGVHSEVITGDTDKGKRARVIDSFRSASLRCIVNVNVLTTGFDAPATDLVALLRPTKSPGLYVQMLGRGMRIAEGKENALVLDFGGNIDRHGPINDVKMPKQPGRGGQSVVKDCPRCHYEGIPAGKRVCPECDYEFPPPEVKVNTKASNSKVIREGVDAGTWLKVKTVWYKRHTKKGKPDSMRVEYWGGVVKLASEWICIEHDGFAQKKAIQWFDDRLGQDDYVPADVAEALDRRAEYKRPARIRVMESNGYDRIVEFDWKGEAPDFMPPQDEQETQQETQASTPEQTQADDDGDDSFDPVELSRQSDDDRNADDREAMDFYGEDDLPF